MIKDSQSTKQSLGNVFILNNYDNIKNSLSIPSNNFLNISNTSVRSD